VRKEKKDKTMLMIMMMMEKCYGDESRSSSAAGPHSTAERVGGEARRDLSSGDKAYDNQDANE
jgi:hypothetical protein